MEQGREWNNLWRHLPKWQHISGKSMGAYNVFWEYPDNFKRDIMPKVFACPKLLDIIVSRCQTVLDSGQFDIDKITLLIRPTGFHISVPGNACGIDPDHTGNSMCGHNVDNPAQAFNLCFLLLTMLDEIYSVASIWEKFPNTGIEETDQSEKWFHLTRSRESKPFRLWGVVNFDYETCGYIYARDWEEAQEMANLFYPEKHQRVEPYWSTEPRPFGTMSKRKYSILVFLKNGDMKTLKVTAYSEDIAFSQVKALCADDEIFDMRIDRVECPEN